MPDIQHVVVIAIRSDVPDAQRETALKALRALRTQLPHVIKSLRVEPIASNLYPGFDDRSGHYTHMLVSTFANAQDLSTYNSSPEHLNALALVRPILAKEDPIVAADIVASHNFDKPWWPTLAGVFGGIVVGSIITAALIKTA
ncbi:uncharacterized protein MONBRDRAFT_31516 [Monosiga brevicollis MX1]|uniref:Stress-response A/B barrel domain-containing protein n=1 Tax=Monosiga brevicollis TaxID=81824 RepID=A9UTQ0_MONBE|nr:uncharacterized protein MONBRDRAFT_31516 [Monosiga brevicollis MX1]EDQ91529.1 predicted protein [Monosiga brevicollis MX1]|eukprot:XP_001743951.1 hypothetical protein [Monosiga brevicollis MX1]